LDTANGEGEAWATCARLAEKEAPLAEIADIALNALTRVMAWSLKKPYSKSERCGDG